VVELWLPGIGDTGNFQEYGKKLQLQELLGWWRFTAVSHVSGEILRQDFTA
jgi:hypothetical protein